MRTTLLSGALLAALLLPQPAQALETDELLALVAMPLAVAAVSEVTDVPMNDLLDVVALLNDAQVPPAQFVEVVRYTPVALVAENDEPDFVEYVRVRRQEGLEGLALVSVIEERIRTYDLPAVELDVIEQRPIDLVSTTEFVPAVVRARVAERSHPRGGPPGQVKKSLGVQTGAEVVHGSARTRDRVLVADDDRKGKGQGRNENKGRGKGKSDSKGKGKG